MARTEKYFLGPKLLSDIRRVVGRVDAEPIASEVTRIPTRLQDMPRRGGGGNPLLLGRVTAAWSKNTLASVVVYDAGDPLEEEFSAPPLIIESCVNKFADVEAGAFVMLGVAHGRHYMIAAECEVPE
jgi:hypothetical protein